jgi:cytochrome c oxidase subunit 1
VAIAFISFGVWAHHMFAVGMSRTADIFFGAMSLVIAIPTGIKTFNWLATVYGGRWRMAAPMLFSLGFLSMFVIGGLTGIILAVVPLDYQLTDSYFVVGHFHFTMGISAIFAVLAGFYFWFPKMWGRMLNETLGKIHFWLTFVLVYCVFMPMHFLGFPGHVRRYSELVDDYLVPLLPTQRFISIAAILLGAVQMLFFFNAIWSYFKGPKAPDNPWEATTLEWDTTSPPPFDNFGGRQITVYHGPMEYNVEGSKGDYVMQSSPEVAKEKV